MAKVLGLGGVFFKSPDPAALRAWYARWLGMFADEEGQGTSFFPDTMPPAGYSLWSPFPQATRYFEPSPKNYMFSLVVDDLDGALAQVRAGGARLMEEIEESEVGRFGWFVDPDGNKVELWEPPAP
jgi:predicted enzyme related to lactoylglutathione lyase